MTFPTLPAFTAGPTFADLLRMHGDFAPLADAAVAARQAAGQRIAELAASPHYADDYKAQLVGRETAAAEQAAAKARARLDGVRDQLLAAAATLAAPTGPAAALDETRQARAWARLAPQLDAGRHWTEILAEVEAARDGAALVALRQELPAWANAQRPPTHGVDTLQPAQRQPDLGDMHTTLDAALFRVLGDDRGHGSAARTRLHVAAQHPLAVARLDQASATGAVGASRLGPAFEVGQAEQQAAAIEAQLAAPAPVAG